MAPKVVPLRAHPLSAPALEEWISLNTACERVGVSRRTLYNWIAAGKIAPGSLRRTVGGAIRVRAGALWQEE